MCRDAILKGVPPSLKMSKKCKNSHIIIILVSFLHLGVLPIIISKFMCCKLKKVENNCCRQSHVYTARWEINWPRWLMPERGLQTSTTHKSVFFDWKNRLTRLYQLQRTYYYKKLGYTSYTEHMIITNSIISYYTTHLV